MKRIIASFGIIVFVGGLVAGATGAFFNDTETSVGNIFTAGAIDLKIDHSGSYYNGLFCDDGVWTCEPWADQVVDFDQGTRKNGSPVLPVRSNPAAMLGPAQTAGNPSDVGFTEADFTALGFKLGFGGWVILKFDNIAVNGAGNDIAVYEVTGGSYPDEQALVEVSQDGVVWHTLGIATRDAQFDLDTVGLPWVQYVRITDQSNPASFNDGTADGFDVDAVKALHCGSDPTVEFLSGESCNGSWDLKDLGEGDAFFTFSDVKPGDLGKNVISFHVDNNDAWACLTSHDVVDYENDLTGPEVLAGDDTPLVGELSQYLYGFAWRDIDGDGYYEPHMGEAPLSEGPFSLLNYNIPLADTSLLGNSEPIMATTTYYLGLAWCMGTMSVDDTWGFITCDGSGNHDVAQTDSVVANVSAYAEQSRNNTGFLCEDIDLTTPTEDENVV